jgi:hypothetical protein
MTFIHLGICTIYWQNGSAKDRPVTDNEGTLLRNITPRMRSTDTEEYVTSYTFLVSPSLYKSRAQVSCQPAITKGTKNMHFTLQWKLQTYSCLQFSATRNVSVHLLS